MSDSNNTESTKHLTINAQYIKDLSFENPKAPHSLIQSSAPKIGISVDVQKEDFSANMHEVVLHLRAEATLEDDLAFLVDLQYAGLFTVPEDANEKVFHVQCPELLFPFLRAVVANITKDSGFPSLLLAPIDFNNIYNERLANQENSRKTDTV